MHPFQGALRERQTRREVGAQSLRASLRGGSQVAEQYSGRDGKERSVNDSVASIPGANEVANLPVDERAELAVSALSNLGPQRQQEALRQSGIGISPADQVTSNRVWMTIVASFAIVLVAAVLGIIVIAFGFLTNTDIQTLLTVFTTAAGFLAGLLSPSPLAKG